MAFLMFAYKACHIAKMAKGTNAFKILIGKPTGKSGLGRPRLRQDIIL